MPNSIFKFIQISIRIYYKVYNGIDDDLHSEWKKIVFVRWVDDRLITLLLACYVCRKLLMMLREVMILSSVFIEQSPFVWVSFGVTFSSLWLCRKLTRKHENVSGIQNSLPKKMLHWNNFSNLHYGNSRTDGFFFHSVRTIDEDGIFSCMAHGEGRVTAIYQIYFH